MDAIRMKTTLPSPIEKVGGGKLNPQNPIGDFGKALSESIEELNARLSLADQATQEMVLGKKDIHEAMAAIEQANLSLRMVIQVRNKMIAAYADANLVLYHRNDAIFQEHLIGI
jgi:flagellar hook-basal body complex protein FliE